MICSVLCDWLVLCLVGWYNKHVQTRNPGILSRQPVTSQRLSAQQVGGSSFTLRDWRYTMADYTTNRFLTEEDKQTVADVRENGLEWDSYDGAADAE